MRRLSFALAVLLQLAHAAVAVEPAFDVGHQRRDVIGDDVVSRDDLTLDFSNEETPEAAKYEETYEANADVDANANANADNESEEEPDVEDDAGDQQYLEDLEAMEIEHEEEEAMISEIEAVLEDELDLVGAMPMTPDVFEPIGSDNPAVHRLVDQFMFEYAEEVGRMSLHADVLQILKAQKTPPRPEVQEKYMETGGINGIDVDMVGEDVTLQVQIFLLLNYSFQSSMLAKRPYVSALRLTMDCAVPTTLDADTKSTDLDDLECETLEHLDLPRVNESTTAVKAELEHAIVNTAPDEYTDGKKLQVVFDAVETQYLDVDPVTNRPVSGSEDSAIHYVRFRVLGGSGEDCMVAVQHTKQLNVLLYSDAICYADSPDAKELAAIAAATGGSKENFPLFVLIASVAGAIVAIVVLRYRRKFQRSGYAYVHSRPGKLPSVPTQQDVAATA